MLPKEPLMSLMKSNKRPSKKPQLYDNYLIIATCVNCLIMRSCIGLTLLGALRRREALNLSCRPGRGRGREKKPFVQSQTIAGLLLALFKDNSQIYLTSEEIKSESGLEMRLGLCHAHRRAHTFRSTGGTPRYRSV